MISNRAHIEALITQRADYDARLLDLKQRIHFLESQLSLSQARVEKLEGMLFPAARPIEQGERKEETFGNWSQYLRQYMQDMEQVEKEKSRAV